MGARFYFAFVAPALLVWGVERGGAWTLLPVVFIFVLMPILDEGVGEDASVSGGGPRRWLFDTPLYLWAGMQVALLLWMLGRARAGLTGEDLVLQAVALGVVTGSGGINVAHELMHRAGRVPRAVAELLMASVTYAHFCVEHVHGHHRNVATPADPATARRGEPVFAFWTRSIVGGVRSAWTIEARRLRGRGFRPWADRRVRYAVLQGLAYVLIAWSGGRSPVLLFALQSLVAVCLLETVNYLEHYGLRRRQVEPGRFEPVRSEHSWNSGRAITNAYLFNLGRHSDHHVLASRPYESLRHRDDAPQLPAGYAAMMLLAFVPPLWFRVMDTRLDEAADRFPGLKES